MRELVVGSDEEKPFKSWGINVTSSPKKPKWEGFSQVLDMGNIKVSCVLYEPAEMPKIFGKWNNEYMRGPHYLVAGAAELGRAIDIGAYPKQMLSLPRETVSTSRSLMFETMRFLSTIAVFGFVTLLGLGIATGGPVHWTISVVGCLGSVGLAGAVWLSKSYWQRHQSD